MKITDSILVNLGADPKIYSISDREKISKYSDSISKGHLIDILKENSMPEESIKSITDKNIERFKSLRTILENITEYFDKISEISTKKNSIFSGDFSSEEKDFLLVNSSQLIKNIGNCFEKANDIIQTLFQSISDMIELQNVCNMKLANLGMLNLASMVIQNQEAGEKVIAEIEGAFNYLNGLTGFLNDLNDKTLICEMTINKELPSSVNRISEFLDFQNDGKNLNSAKVKEECKKALLFANNVLKNQLQGGTI